MSGWPQSDVTKLSTEAQALMHRMLDQRELPNDIRRAIGRLTGEKVLLTELARYAKDYWEKNSEESEARTQTDKFVELAGKKGVKVSELMRALLVEMLVVARREKQLQKEDLFKLDDAERKRREFELKLKQERKAARREAKELEMKERQVRLAEEKLELTREQMGAALDKLDRKAETGKALTPEDVRRIREIYGLAEEKESAGEPNENGDG